MVALLAVAIAAVIASGIAAASSRPARAIDPGGEAAPTQPEAASAVTASAPEVALPVRIDIPRLGVVAPVDTVGRLADGTMAVPEDYARAGWYEGLEAPGEVGTAVIVGHLDSHTGPAVFFEVPTLEAGDEITVTRADSTTVRFIVERTEQYQKDRFPTIAVYGPTDRPTLRLITCGGSFDRGRGHYRDNVVVYAQEAT